MSWDGHTCPLPLVSRRHWWTCSDCGQLWRKSDGAWKLTARETSIEHA